MVLLCHLPVPALLLLAKSCQLARLPNSQCPLEDLAKWLSGGKVAESRDRCSIATANDQKKEAATAACRCGKRDMHRAFQRILLFCLMVTLAAGYGVSLRPSGMRRLRSQQLQLQRAYATAARGFSEMTTPSATFLSPKIVLGRGIVASTLRQALPGVGKRPLLVTGKGGAQRFRQILEEALPRDFDYSAQVVSASGEPTIEQVVAGALQARSLGCDCVVAFGGGSAIDLGKAIAAMATQTRDIFTFLEVIGQAQPLDHAPLPLIAIPTTSGTGSEATKNAVVKSTTHRRKVSLRHDKLLPALAIVDPTLTLSCPPSLSAQVGADTLCQVLEPFLCSAPNPIVDALSREGIVRAARSLGRVITDGGDIEAREDMAIASVLGGLALANARLGTVHGFAAVLGGMFDDAPHGAICATLLPHVFEANIKAIRLRGDQHKLERFHEAARLLSGDRRATAEAGTEWLLALVKEINIPSLGRVCPGLRPEDFESIVLATQQASSTKGNAAALANDELHGILERAL